MFVNGTSTHNDWGEMLHTYDTRPCFFEEVVVPLREDGYTGRITERIPRKWWKFWRPRCSWAHWDRNPVPEQ